LIALLVVIVVLLKNKPALRPAEIQPHLLRITCCSDMAVFQLVVVDTIHISKTK